MEGTPTSRVVAVCVTVVLVVAAVAGMAAAVSISGTLADRDAFKACIAANRPPAECRLAIYGTNR